jgi:flagellar biosynthesis/type III secretory pathway protein FliH
MLPMANIKVLEQFPELKKLPQFDPENLTASDVLKIITIALAKTAGADPLAGLRAQAVMEEQYARGNRDGYARGRRDGYQAAYLEGLEDGRKEALDKSAQEEAERVSIKAAARAKRLPQATRDMKKFQ